MHWQNLGWGGMVNSCYVNNQIGRIWGGGEVSACNVNKIGMIRGGVG